MNGYAYSSVISKYYSSAIDRLIVEYLADSQGHDSHYVLMSLDSMCAMARRCGISLREVGYRLQRGIDPYTHVFTGFAKDAPKDVVDTNTRWFIEHDHLETDPVFIYRFCPSKLRYMEDL